MRRTRNRLIAIAAILAGVAVPVGTAVASAAPSAPVASSQATWMHG